MAAPYVQRYAGGFNDLGLAGGKPVDAAWGNAVEDALLRLLGVAPAQDTVGVWTPGGANGALVYQKVTNAQVDAAAAIARSKLDFGAGLTNADIAAAAAISVSKLAGYPADLGKTLRGDGSWLTQPKITTSSWSGGPPASPTDGDIWIATAVSTNGERWAFQYNAGSGSAYKWECIGGSPYRISYGNLGTVINAATQIGATAFYTFTVFPGSTAFVPARAGDYRSVGTMAIYTGGSAAGGQIQVQPWGPGTAALIGGYAITQYAPPSYNGNIAMPLTGVFTGLAAGSSYGWAVSTPANGTYQFSFIDFGMIPIRVA